MTDRFDECLAVTLRFEGGYSNVKADHGGATNKGVTQKTYDDYKVRKGQARSPVLGISYGELKEIYQDGYWSKCSCAALPPPVDLVCFDAAVNSGPGRAAKFLQRTLGVPADGTIGPKTLAAVNVYCEVNGAKHLARECIQQREDFLDDLIAADPTQVKFQAGWDNRLTKLREVINK